MNLIGNAIQHGGGTPVTLRATEEGDAVTLAVHHGGPPIPPNMLPVVFEPLVRGHAETTGHSIGLGLFIARANRVGTRRRHSGEFVGRRGEVKPITHGSRVCLTYNLSLAEEDKNKDKNTRRQATALPDCRSRG